MAVYIHILFLPHVFIVSLSPVFTISKRFKYLRFRTVNIFWRRGGGGEYLNFELIIKFYDFLMRNNLHMR